MPPELQTLPWQATGWAGIARRIADDTLPHALLLAGPAGIGKARLALRLAAALLCEAGTGGEPCGACPACRWCAREEHPDLHLCRPEAGKTQIRVDAVRQLIDFLALSGHRQARKVALIEPAEAMNVNAANSLLKVLEEPPAGGHLVLVSHQPGRLPATVRSRCQRLDLPLPDTRAALAWLQAQGVAAEEAATLLQLAGGAPGRALAWAAPEARAAREDTWRSLRDLARGRGGVMAVAETWAADQPHDRLHWWGHWLLQLRRLQAGAAEALPEGMAAMQGLPPAALHEFAARLLQVQALLQGPSNAALQLAELLYRWVALTRPLRTAEARRA